MALKMIDFSAIEKKWQKRWENEKAFEVKEGSAKNKKKKFYVLEMYPYPSGSGLHMGHAFNYTIGDIYARLKRMQGFNVLYPMGYDSFGLPAENAAIKAKSHPKKFTEQAIKNYIKQQKELGLSYDWTRMVMSHDSEFYKWDQWIFLKMFEKGLAYRKKAPVNWCGKCRTVLANEQVKDGKCYLHEDEDVQIKQLEQWFLKITDYADELYEGINKLEGWPETIKKLQKNWIGKSYGAEVDFEIPWNEGTNFVLLHGFTADPDEDFHPWLKKELESRGYAVQVPKLPNTNKPDIEEQINYVIKNFKFNKDTIVLGHSLGSVVAQKVVERLNKPIKKLILAAGFCDKIKGDRIYNNTFDWKFDFDKIKKNCDDIILLRDKNDSVISNHKTLSLQKNTRGKLVEFLAESDHICGKAEPIVLDNCLQKFPVFTTRVDTLFGVTFLVVSAQHPELDSLVSKEQRKKVDAFLKKVRSVSEKDMDVLDKEGVFTGSYALHPLTGEKIPIWVGNFVVADYGSGMVMAVPAHDQRDYDFAKKYGIEIKEVVKDTKLSENVLDSNGAFTDYGVLVNSEGFDGLKSEEAKEHITNALEMKKKGRKKIAYRLKDWLISRQRFWGCPIPIVYCDRCGIVPVKEKELPVKLPDNIKFNSAENPLKSYKKFTDVKCPKCGGEGRRETDTMDTFVDSSWYFLRYTDNKNKSKIFDSKRTNYWAPIDQYIGGKEHATGHLIYSRFFTKFLRDLRFLDFGEPAVRLFNQGMLHASDGRKMSKSYGNVVLPESVSKKYGIDSARLFLVSSAGPDKDIDWSDKGIEGSLRFIMRVMDFGSKFGRGKNKRMMKLQESKMHRTIRDYTSDLEGFRYNLAVIKLRELFGVLEDGCDRKSFESFLKMFSVICPHVAEELWSKLGNKKLISLSEWPKPDLKKIDDKLEEAYGNVERTIEDVRNIKGLIDVDKPTTVYIYTIPADKEVYDNNKEKIKAMSGADCVEIYAVNDEKKHDPEGKSKKAKPGRPGIYVA